MIKDKIQTDPQGNNANTLLPAVAPTHTLSTDGIALDCAAVSRGNGIGATSVVYLMDCIKGMKQFPDKHFDLAIVDPPYGIRQDGHRENNRSKLAKSKSYHKALWDQPAPNHEYFEELFRVSKNQIIWGANHFIESFSKNSSCWIVWDKDRSGHFADCELAWASFDTAVRMFKYRWNGMLQEDMKNKEERIHPTQKPIQLYSWLLTNYAKEGDRILDTHLGSGSSRIAAHIRDFDFTGFELDEEYFYTKARIALTSFRRNCR